MIKQEKETQELKGGERESEREVGWVGMNKERRKPGKLRQY